METVQYFLYSRPSHEICSNERALCHNFLQKCRKSTSEESIHKTYISRMALMKLLAQSSQKASWDELHLNNYQYLTHFPKALVSLSHTKDTGAAALATKGEVQGVGIDIELKDRHLNPKAKHHFINEMDVIEEYTLLELWVIKEAIFKATWNRWNNSDKSKTFVLKDIVLSSPECFHIPYLKNCQGRFELINQDKHLIAIATH